MERSQLLLKCRLWIGTASAWPMRLTSLGVSRSTSAMRASIGSACGPIRSAPDGNRIACGRLMNEAPWLQPHVEAVLLQAGRAGGSAGIQEPRYRASHWPVELARPMALLAGSPLALPERLPRAQPELPWREPESGGGWAGF